jgi:Fur family peroxide stress response transcriptional regulator
MNDDRQVRERITEAGLKVTPQRLIVLKTLYELGSHPSAEQVIEHIRRDNPHIITGTVYNILEVFAGKGIIKRVKTEDGILRYDALKKKHLHIYCTDTGKIEDYYDTELSLMLDDYFRRKKIDGFEIEELNLHIIGKHNTNRKN